MSKTVIKISLILALTSILYSCSANVNLSRCEINLKQGETDIPHDKGYFDFGNIPLGFSQSITFTIENNGSEILKLTGNPIVSVFGQDEEDFVKYTHSTETSVMSQESTEFTIQFLPQSLGQKTAKISIESNDKDESPYTFVIVGNCSPPAPEMHIKQDTMDIFCSTGKFDFGNINVSSSSESKMFIIQNLGNEDLIFSGNPDKIIKSGVDASMFDVNQTNVKSPLSGNHSTYFHIVFKPTSAGIKTAKISIVNNDSDENPYTFTLYGSGVTVPEINITQGSNNILNGKGKYTFNDTTINNSSSEITFTIENLGTSALHLSENPVVKINGTDSSMFTLNLTTTSDSIAPGSNTIFGITFKPTLSDLLSATVFIANNDDDENPYTFTIEGNCIGPEMIVKQGSDIISHSTGVYYFVAVKVGETTPEIEFTIENTGVGDLKLTGSPIIEITGTGASYFIIDYNSTSSSISPGNSTMFKIKCNPTTRGLKTATVSISNNDGSNNPYTFTINGFAVVHTTGDINGDGIVDIVVGADHNSEGGTDAGSAYIFFGRTNFSAVNNASTANVKLIGENPSDLFSMSISSTGDVNNDGFEDIVIGAIYGRKGSLQYGKTYIFFGNYHMKTKINASEADVQILGHLSDSLFGYSVTSGGDINNDGINDIVVGAKNDWNWISNSRSGVSYIYWGRNQWTSQLDTSDADVILNGERVIDYFGCSVSSNGDVNNDGIDDLLVGAYRSREGSYIGGSVYIFFGKSSWASSILAENADVKLYGITSGAYLGRTVSACEDVNKDGIDDVLTGAYLDNEGGSESGSAYLFFGRTNWQNKISESNADVKFIGGDIDDNFGKSVYLLKDINKDGINDLIIGAQEDDDGGDRSGCAFIFFGRTTWNSKIDATQANVKLVGEKSSNRFGYNVYNCLDVNNDSSSDVLIGAPYAGYNGTYGGGGYVFFGRSNWSSTANASTANVKFYGENSGDLLGLSYYGN